MVTWSDKIVNGLVLIADGRAIVASGSHQIANWRGIVADGLPQVADWMHKSPDGRVRPASGLIKLGVLEMCLSRIIDFSFLIRDII